MPPFILACDEGTSSARSALFDGDGHIVASVQQPISSQFPQEGWVQQNADEIWRVQLATIRELLEDQQYDIDSIAAIGITNQRESTVVWDLVTGQPLGPVVTWQCRRTQEACETIRQNADQDRWITDLTGLRVDPYFSATKIRWLLDSVPDAQARAEAGELAFGTVDSWLVYQLTAGNSHVIDRTNASRTMLMNLATGDWDEQLLSYFNIPMPMLPTIVGSVEIVDHTSEEVLGKAIPIAGIAGDQQAAMVGQSCNEEHSAKLTYGTGAFLLVHSGDQIVRSSSGLLSTTVASNLDHPQFALEGSVFSAGSAIQWLRDEIGLIQSAEETEAIALSISDSKGVHLVPAFEGLGAPHWAPNVRGSFHGLTRGADRRHLVRATLESIAFQVYDLVDTLERDSHVHLKELRVDGGAAANNFLLQFQADLLGIPVVRPRSLESTIKGAALLAQQGINLPSSGEYEVDKVFEPKMSPAERELKLEGWREVVDQVLSRATADK